jgi:hypothetical protein
MLNLFKKGKRKEQFVLRLARLVKQNVHEKKRDPTGLAGGGTARYCRPETDAVQALISSQRI